MIVNLKHESVEPVLVMTPTHSILTQVSQMDLVYQHHEVYFHDPLVYFFVGSEAP